MDLRTRVNIFQGFSYEKIRLNGLNFNFLKKMNGLETVLCTVRANDVPVNIIFSFLRKDLAEDTSLANYMKFKKRYIYFHI